MTKSKKSVSISIFLDERGRLRQLPAPNRTKIPALNYLAEKFEQNRMYSEPEVNEILSSWHTFGDFHLLRRLLVDYGFMLRVPDGSRYWRNNDNGEENGHEQEKGT